VLLKEFYYILIIFAIILLLSSCNLFTTRNPETPNTGKSNFQPPTSADIVISNFKYAVIEKNVDNYIQCFADTSQNTKRNFIFIASSEANAVFNFQNWNVNSERQYFNSLINKTPLDNVPVIIFSNSRFDVSSTDSTVFTSDYYLYVNHSDSTFSKKFAGTLQFSLSPKSSGLWSIYQWIDSSPSGNDTIKSTWSMMKAKFSY
jgi:hypothetical protein